MRTSLHVRHSAFWRARSSVVAFGLVCFSVHTPAQKANSTPLPANAPTWLPAAYRTLISVALPNSFALTGTSSTVPTSEFDLDSAGTLESYQPGGATAAAGNAFFKSLGTNGRSCVTCHEPPSALGLSVANIATRYLTSLGTDPLFAPVDGANCPSLARSPLAHPGDYSLLLSKGLIRIALPVPSNAQYTISIVSDPYGCNTNPAYNQVTSGSTTSQIISVYRRPLIASNLKFKVESGADLPGFALGPVDPITNLPLPLDPTSQLPESGNIMWDGREPTLSSQAIDATFTHAQATVAPTAAQVAQIVEFESGIYSAQESSFLAGNLTNGGATGGPVNLSSATAGLAAVPGAETVNDYDAWNPANGSQSSIRASIYRGQQLFNSYPFTISNVAGLNNIAALNNPPFGPNSITGTCTFCHSQVNGTTDSFPVAQHAIGIGGVGAAFGGPAPSTSLPIFQVTCKPGFTTPYNGTVVLTNDPGKALITGACADVGRFTVGSMRGLASRAPYFSDGSAATLTSLVTFYNKRFNMNLTAQNITDLVNFLSTL